MSSANDDGLNGRQMVVVVVSAICIVAPTIAVALRFLSRRLCHAKLWWDDYFCAIALLLAYGPCVCAILAIRHGLGRHSNELASSDFVQISKIFYPLQITWMFNFGFTYAAIALLYLRYFPETLLAKAAVVMGAIGMLTAIADIGVLIWQCHPIAFVWDNSIPGGHCINQHRAYTAASALILVLIFVLFFLPLPTMYGMMNMSPTKTLGLTLTLSMGAFVCITSVFCLVNVLQWDSKDISWNASPANAWACLGSSSGVVVACLPSLAPLIRILRDRGKKKSRRGSSDVYTDGSRSTPRSKRLSRILDRRKPSATFSERIDLQSRTHRRPDDHDDRARLVSGNIKPNDILITRQVLQVTEAAHPKDLEEQKREDGILPQAWRARSPPP